MNASERLTASRYRSVAEAYRVGLSAKIEALTSLGRQLGPGEQEVCAAVKRIAHQLRGSGATFGFPEITKAAALVEDAASDCNPDHVRELVEVLRTVQGEAGSARVLLVEDDSIMVEVLRVALRAPGRTLVHVGTAQEARRLLRDGGTSESSRITHAFTLCLSRPPNDQEFDRTLDLYNEMVKIFQADEDVEVVAVSDEFPL